ncbi:type II toxin-antitoxin system VapB family antitoxin [bacterium]|nr:type II toxin-antitoxin system VapB family antitoxin [bacterium]
MNLQIRDARARALARELAEKRKTSMTEAVIMALESELRREAEKKPLAERARAFAAALRAQSAADGRDMTQDEIDAMWGHD